MLFWLIIGCVKSVQVESFESTWSTVNESFPYEDFNGVDWEAVHDEYLPQAKKAKSNDELRPILSEMITELNVSHIGVIPSEAYDRAKKSTSDENDNKDDSNETENQDEIIPQGWVGLDARWIDNRLLVAQVKGAAKTSGVQLGWEILAIDGVDSTKSDAKSLREQQFEMGRLAIGSFEGNANQDLDITFENLDGELIEMAIPFEADGTITTPEMGNLPICGIRFEHYPLESGPYYMQFNMFLMPIKDLVTEAFESAVRQNSPGLIIDLRGNPGGLINLGVYIASHLIAQPDLDLGQQISKDGTLYLSIYPRHASQRFDGPVAILIDDLSASTSEVLAGGLQDLERVEVFGIQSAGKALPSVIKDLPNGDRLQYIIFDLKTPKGARYEGDGVQPNHIVAHSPQSLAEGRDMQLEAAVDWILTQSTSPSRITPSNENPSSNKTQP